MRLPWKFTTPRLLTNPERRWVRAAFLALGLACAAAPTAGAQAGCVDGALAIGASPTGDGEPSIRTDPTDPRRLVAAWTTQVTPPPPSADSPIVGRVVLAQRNSQGQWNREIVSPGLDPWLDISPNGIAYLAYLTLTDVENLRVLPVGPGGPLGGSVKVPVGLQLDHPAIAVDQNVSPTARDRLYLVYSAPSVPFTVPFTALLTESLDGGTTWTSPIPFPSGFGQSQLAPVIATGGTQVLVSWIEVDPLLGSSSPVGTVRAALYDATVGQFTSVTDIASITGGVKFQGTFASQFGAAALPSLSIARKGAATGTAYLTWPQRGGPGLEPNIFVSTSPDGVQWSPPQKVNDDSDPLTPHFYPSVSAQENGAAAIAWMDGRDDPSGQTVRLYITQVRPDSTVGASRRVTDCPSHTESVPVGSSAYGDYFNFDAYEGRIDLIFPQVRKLGGDSDVFYTSLP